MATAPNYVAEHFAAHPGPVRPALVCKDGFRMSVQGSAGHYCTPREDGADYTSVEVWAWSQQTVPAKLRGFYKSKHDPLGWVPVSAVNALVHQHGGRA